MDTFWNIKSSGPSPTFLHQPRSTFQTLHQYFCWLGSPLGWETPWLPQCWVIFCIRGVTGQTQTSFLGNAEGDKAWASTGNCIGSAWAVESHIMWGFCYCSIYELDLPSNHCSSCCIVLKLKCLLSHGQLTEHFFKGD